MRPRHIRRLANAEPSEEVLALLADAARDHDRAVREAAMFALDKLPPDTTALLVLGLEDEDEWVRLRASIGLAHQGDRRGVEVLRAAVDADDHDAALLALDGLGALEEDELPLEVLRDPSAGSALREAAIDALGRSRSREATDALQEAAQYPDRVLRRAAQRALRARRA